MALCLNSAQIINVSRNYIMFASAAQLNIYLSLNTPLDPGG